MLSQSDLIRPAGVAGTYYPADKLMLERELSLLLEAAPVLEFPRPIRGMIVPHGGFLYSGGVAARAYRQIMDQPLDCAVILAPPHESRVKGISVYAGRAFRTPLGDVPVHRELVARLLRLAPQISLSAEGFDEGEYTIEVQLPFLKWVQEKIRILPIMMGAQDSGTRSDLVQALISLAGEEKLIFIASTDLSQNRPASQARQMDQICQNDIARFDPARLEQHIAEGSCEMCGFGCALAVMEVCQALGASESKVLLYRNSSDLSGEREKTVGYLAAVFY